MVSFSYEPGSSLCALLAVSGLYFLITEGYRLLNLLVPLFGIVGFGLIACKALDRREFYQNNTPKLTLSADAICDHRTGVNVEFLDATSFHFDQQFHKGNEFRASLHLALKDGTGHFFDLRNLSTPSKEIAQKVQSNSGLESVKPAVSSNPRQDKMFAIIAILMVSFLVLRIVFGLFGIDV